MSHRRKQKDEQKERKSKRKARVAENMAKGNAVEQEIKTDATKFKCNECGEMVSLTDIAETYSQDGVSQNVCKSCKFSKAVKK